MFVGIVIMQKPASTIALALLFGTTAASAQSVPGSSLRIATYNAYLLSPAFKCLKSTFTAPVDCFVQVEGQTEIWARRLASTILANRANIDVIAINEVWDEDAKRSSPNDSAKPIQYKSASSTRASSASAPMFSPTSPKSFTPRPASDSLGKTAG